MRSNRTHVEIEPHDYSYVFNPYREPIAAADPGDQVVIHCNDAFESRIQSEDDILSEALAKAKFLNPQTGPIYITGAEPGDTLVVHIKEIEATREFAVSCLIPYFGGLTSTIFTRTLQEPLPEKVGMAVERRQAEKPQARCRDPLATFHGNAGGGARPGGDHGAGSGSFGGNMDVPDVKPGNTVYLPVWNEGGLFYTGDTHANQGEGELCGVGLEITSKVTVEFGVIKDRTIEWPRIESPDRIMTVGSARPMEDAARIAYAELVLWSKPTKAMSGGMLTSSLLRWEACTRAAWSTRLTRWWRASTTRTCTTPRAIISACYSRFSSPFRG